MTDIIASDLQQLETDSKYVELFELVLDSGNILYFHPGLEEDLTTVQFRDRESPHILRTYVAMPVMMEGLDLQADGAMSRPTLTIANIIDKFSTVSGNFTNKSLVGKTLIRRRTLKKHLHGEREAGAAGTVPTEFPVIKYIIDRIAAETSTIVTFEVAAPYDLQNIKLPRRVVVGKYCSWEYQGAASGRGGCIFPRDSAVKRLDNLTNDNDKTLRTHYGYFNDKNEPLVSATWLLANTSAWSASSVSYTQESYVSHSGKYWQSLQVHTSSSSREPGTTAGEAFWKQAHHFAAHDNTSHNYSVGDHVSFGSPANIWKCILAHNSSTSTAGTIEPSYESAYWVREDLCSKTLQGCKCRFQFVPVDYDTANQPPSSRKDTNNVLPFGGFPGTYKF